VPAGQYAIAIDLLVVSLCIASTVAFPAVWPTDNLNKDVLLYGPTLESIIWTEESVPILMPVKIGCVFNRTFVTGEPPLSKFAPNIQFNLSLLLQICGESAISGFVIP
jgi:hypothetical protein